MHNISTFQTQLSIEWTFWNSDSEFNCITKTFIHVWTELFDSQYSRFSELDLYLMMYFPSSKVANKASSNICIDSFENKKTSDIGQEAPLQLNLINN